MTDFFINPAPASAPDPQPLQVEVVAVPPQKKRTKTRWLIALGALLGALLPAVLELGILGPDIASLAAKACDVVQVVPPRNLR